MTRSGAACARCRTRRSTRPRPRCPNRAAPAAATLRAYSADRRRGQWQSLRQCIAVARSPWRVCAESRSTAWMSGRRGSAEAVRVSYRDEQMRRGRAALMELVTAAGQGPARGLGRNQMREVVGGHRQAQPVAWLDYCSGWEDLDVVAGQLAGNHGLDRRPGAEGGGPQAGAVGAVPGAIRIQ